MSICVIKVSAGFLASVREGSHNNIITQKTHNVFMFALNYYLQVLNKFLFPQILNHLLSETNIESTWKPMLQNIIITSSTIGGRNMDDISWKPVARDPPSLLSP